MRKNLVLLIALTLLLTACTTKPKETVKETKKEIKLETIKETKDEKKKAELKEKLTKLKNKIDKDIEKEARKKLEEKGIKNPTKEQLEKDLEKKSQKENIKVTKKEELKVTQKETSKTQKTKQKEKVWVVDVKKQDPVYENKCVVVKEAWTETTDELIDFDQIIKPRWFVRFSDGSIKYYYSAKEASDAEEKYLHDYATGKYPLRVTNWGTAQDEMEIVNKKYKTIEHPAETKCEQVLVKEAVKEQGHWEYR
ncbi:MULTISPECIES: hypothetical protein [Helcococcus]|uniref:Lipoprotein n=1 Tax=Helcococcus bovis TaxID=3153252 RepID=A0ABW9F517_9FIRM